MNKIKLGQKVKYERILQKTGFTTWSDEFREDFEELKQYPIREIRLIKERIGYVFGKRKLLWSSDFVEVVNYDEESERKAFKMDNPTYIIAYAVAYDLQHTNYVLGGDLKLVEEK